MTSFQQGFQENSLFNNTCWLPNKTALEN